MPQAKRKASKGGSKRRSAPNPDAQVLTIGEESPPPRMRRGEAADARYSKPEVSRSPPRVASVETSDAPDARADDRGDGTAHARPDACVRSG